MATELQTDDLSRLRNQIRESLREVGYGDTPVQIVWLTRPPEEAEVLVEVTLPSPGKQGIWNQKTTTTIRTAIRRATSEVMPWAVATTRLVPADDDDDA